MTNFTFEIVDQRPDGVNLNINWDNFNAISILVSKKELENLHLEIESFLKELERSK